MQTLIHMCTWPEEHLNELALNRLVNCSSSTFRERRFCAYEDTTGKEKHRFLIPSAQKYELKKQLADMGIHRAMIYPGLDGLSHHLRWKIERGRLGGIDLNKSEINQRFI